VPVLPAYNSATFGPFRQRPGAYRLVGMSAPSLQLPPAHEGGAEAHRIAVFRDSPWLLGFQVAILLVITGTVVTRFWSDHVWFGWCLVALATLLWLPELSVPRVRRWWYVYVVGIFVYTILRSYADETAIPTRFDYVIEFDRLLPGPQPVPWLQDLFFARDRVTWFDYAMVGVHWSFFIAPHLAAVLVCVFRPDLFSRFVLLMVGVMWLGLVLFFLVPTAPPWFAGTTGHLDGVYRVMDFVGGQVSGDTYEQFYASLGEPNSVAAMPSIHMAVTFVLFLWARENHRRLQWPLLGYCLLMGFALVYLGEHYVADEVVGIACALAVYVAVRRLLGPAIQAAR